MRRLAVLASLALLAVGCGGGSGSGKQSHTVLAVSKVFYDAGIPFTTEQTFNPWVNGQAVFLPGKLNTSDLRNAIQAGLSQTTNFTGVVCWVFDTDAHAADALKVVPLSKWLTGDAPIVRVHSGNVIIVASGWKGADKQKLAAALSSF